MTPLPLPPLPALTFLSGFRFQLFRTFRSFPALVAAGLLAVLQATAWAQAPGSYIDPPGRVARLNLMEGAVSFSPADIAGSQDASAWTPAMLNRPLTRSDRLWTGPRARAELHIGSTAVRMNEQTSLDFLALDDDVVQLRLAQGTLRLRVRTLFEGQRLEVNTPNLAFVISQPGDYRLDANLATDTTRVVVQSGGGIVYGDSGLPVTLASQQQVSFTGTQLTPGAPGSTVLDSFDLWALERDRIEDQSVSARYVPREVIGYQQLDLYGDWSRDPTYGAVWLPRAVPLHWAPYRMGYWSWIAPWGWTWIDDAPWGFAPFHYGRWALIGQRWAWVPGRLAARPVYAPALVVFVGGSSGGVNWSISIGSGGALQPALGWFPLAPGEAFLPIYRVSPRYITQVNQNIVVNTTINVTNIYRYQRQPAAMTVVSADDFVRGRPVRGNLALSLAELSRAPVVVDRSAIPQRPDVQRPRLAAAAALPPAPVVTQPVVRGRDERRDDRRDERRTDDRRDGRAQPALPAAPATQGLIGAQPPARPGQITPPALQDRSAADAEQRARREQQQLQREQERQQRETARPQDAQRRQADESLIQRAQRERLQGGMPAASPDARAAAERNAIDTEQRARREQQQLQREQERQQREAAQQQEAQRRQNEESLIQRAQRERAAAAERSAIEQSQRAQQQQQQLQREQERQQREAAQQQEAQRRQNEESLIQRAQRERAAAAERSAIEQSQRAQQQQQLQREQERQQRELIRQQDQQRRQNEELLGQRALREQAQRAQAQAQQRAQREQQRQAHELQQQQQQQQQLQQQEQRKAQQRKQAREADAANAPGPRPEGLPGRFREQ